MHVPENVNYLAVLVAGIVIFLLGWLWYSVLCKNQWMALHGKTEAELKAPAQGSMAGMYISHLVASLIIAWVLAVILNHFVELDWMRGALVGVLCWLGFVATTTYSNVVATMKPKQLWVIDAGFYLVAFAIAGAILAVWR